MTDVAAAVVAGLGKADAGTRERIRAEALDQARQAMREGKVQLLSTGTVIVGTR